MFYVTAERKRVSKIFSFHLQRLIVAFASLVVLLIARPERQVVSQELHDERGVFVGVLVQGVQFGDRVVESRLGQMAGLLGCVLDLVVEDGVIERQAQADGVRRLHVLFADLVGLAVGLLRRLHHRGFLSPVATSAR